MTLSNIITFTGTRNGMTDEQKARFRRVVVFRSPDIFMHGDCVGADADAHLIVSQILPDVSIHIWPCDFPNMRAFCKGATVVHAIDKPLARNRSMAMNAETVIACPPCREEQRRGGTWSTVRFARRIGRRVIVIAPEGDILPEL